MYDRLTILSYNLGVIDFGAGANVTRDIPLPPGARLARVLDINVHVTEIFETSTSDAAVQVGRTGDLDEFAELTIPNGSTVGTIVGARTSASGRVHNSVYVAEKGNTAALDSLRVTCVFGTDDSAVTGQGEVIVHIGYDQADADDGNDLG